MPVTFNATLGPAVYASDIPDYAQVLTIVACSLSILGSLIIIITYILWKDLRTMSRHLLLCLSLVDFVCALSLGYGTIRNFSSNTMECQIQSIFGTFCMCSSFLWTLSIAVYLYITIVWEKVELANSLCPLYHVISWGIPAICVGVAYAFDGLGWDYSNLTVGWCWVNQNSEYPLLWMLLLGKVWEILACVSLPMLCILMKLHIHREHISGYRFEASYNSPEVVAMVAMDRRLTLLPLLFVALRVFGVIRFAAYLSGSSLAVCISLMTLQSVSACSQGSANCLIYFLLAKNVRQRLFLSLRCYKPKRSNLDVLYGSRNCTPCRFWCYSVCACHCCKFDYVRVNTESFYSDLAESSPLLRSV